MCTDLHSMRHVCMRPYTFVREWALHMYVCAPVSECVLSPVKCVCVCVCVCVCARARANVRALAITCIAVYVCMRANKLCLSVCARACVPLRARASKYVCMYTYVEEDGAQGETGGRNRSSSGEIFR